MEMPFAMDPVEFWLVSFFSHPLMPVAWAVDLSWGEEMIPSAAKATDGQDPWVMPLLQLQRAPFTGRGGGASAGRPWLPCSAESLGPGSRGLLSHSLWLEE